MFNLTRIIVDFTYSQEWCPILPSKLGCQHHALSATHTEATWDNDTGGTPQLLPCLVVLVLFSGLGLLLKVFGVDPDQIQLPSQMHRRVLQGLHHRQVGIVCLDVLANQSNVD